MPLCDISLVVGLCQCANCVVWLSENNSRVLSQSLDCHERFPAGLLRYVAHLLFLIQRGAKAIFKLRSGEGQTLHCHKRSAVSVACLARHARLKGDVFSCLRCAVWLPVVAIFNDGLPGDYIGVADRARRAHAAGCCADGKGVIGRSQKGEDVNDVGAADRNANAFYFSFFDGEIQNVSRWTQQIEVGVGIAEVGDQQCDGLAGQQFHLKIIIQVASFLGASRFAGARFVNIAAQGDRVGKRLCAANRIIRGKWALRVIGIPIDAHVGRNHYRAADTKASRGCWWCRAWSWRCRFRRWIVTSAPPSTGC